MSWHHGDYIDLASSVGTVVAAFMAVKATKVALLTSEDARENTRLTTINNDYDRTFGLILQLSERANKSIDTDAHIKKELGAVIEFISAVNSAFYVIESSALPSNMKDELKETLKKTLRPGIFGELKDLDAYLAVNGHNYQELEPAYLEAIRNLGVVQRTNLPIQSLNLTTT